jgi:hypothetical protein
MFKNIIVFICLVIVVQLNAQNASAVWPLTSATTTAFTASGDITAQNESLSNMVINNYSGPNASQRVTTGDGSWPAETEQNENRYIQFVVSPAQGNNLNITAISMQLGASGGVICVLIFFILFHRISVILYSLIKVHLCCRAELLFPRPQTILLMSRYMKVKLYTSGYIPGILLHQPENMFVPRM